MEINGIAENPAISRVNSEPIWQVKVTSTDCISLPHSPRLGISRINLIHFGSLFAVGSFSLRFAFRMSVTFLMNVYRFFSAVCGLPSFVNILIRYWTVCWGSDEPSPIPNESLVWNGLSVVVTKQ